METTERQRTQRAKQRRLLSNVTRKSRWQNDLVGRRQVDALHHGRSFQVAFGHHVASMQHPFARLSRNWQDVGLSVSKFGSKTMVAGLKSMGSIRVVALSAAVAAASWAVAQNRDLPGSAANVPSTVQPAPGGPQAASGAAGAKATERLREGTRLVDVVGAFQSIGGESVTFTPGAPADKKDSFRVLENLALQRVSQVLDENKGARQWTVSGMITEYKGNNYLLLTKTVVHPQDGDSAASQ
jgi:hypothetical protein